MEDEVQKFICFNCVGESYLKAEIKRFGKRAQCTYCKKKSKSFSLEDIADKIDQAFNAHYLQEFEDDDFDSISLKLI